MGLNNKTSNTFRVLENNKQYSIFVNIYVSEGNTDEDLNVSLNMADLEEVVYENKFNDLLLHGHVIFVDKYGDMDKFMSKQYVYLDLTLSYDEEKEDKTHASKPMTEDDTLVARFIVQNMKILSRVGYTVKYKLDIISRNWFNCVAKLDFTNYGKDPEPVFDIFKTCLVQQGLKIKQEMFDKVKTEVKLNYITQ